MAKITDKKAALSALIYAAGGQKELGKMVGVCQKTVSKWLVGNINISICSAIKLEKAAADLGLEGITIKVLMSHVGWV